MSVGDAVVAVSAGKHLVFARSANGISTFKVEVEVGEGQELVVEIKLKADNQSFFADLARHPIWTDPDTGLMWTRQPIGHDQNWKKAESHCRKLALSGYSGWRLPAIDELEGIYDPSAKPNLSVEGDRYGGGWYWSSTRSNAPGEALGFGFYKGKRTSWRVDHGYTTNTICVRGTGK